MSKTAKRYAVLAGKALPDNMLPEEAIEKEGKERLAKINRFCREWQQFIVQPYIEEIQKRADQLRLAERVKNQRRTPAQIESLAKSCGNLGIFDVYRRADRLLIAAGGKVEKLVGNETRELLADQCANAVADVYDRRLYRLVKKHFYNRTN